jgi:hypothetical protein
VLTVIGAASLIAVTGILARADTPRVGETEPAPLTGARRP